MKSANKIFGSILILLGLLYGLNALEVIGITIFSIAFFILIILVPALTEHLKISSTREYIVKGIFAGCLLLAMFTNFGLVFELIMAGVIMISGIIMIFFDVIKNIFRNKEK